MGFLNENPRMRMEVAKMLRLALIAAGSSRGAVSENTAEKIFVSPWDTYYVKEFAHPSRIIQYE
jgi:hypothetical protein